jgi:photosystem II stability/assembly factor-like uncharacterized protein
MVRAWPRLHWRPARSRAIRDPVPHVIDGIRLRQGNLWRAPWLVQVCPGVRLTLRFLLLVTWLAPAVAAAHDASTYGGVFRSRSMGGSWLNADVGLFLSAPLVVAVDPRDPNHLMMGTDSGLLASVNGGRSWTREASTSIIGAVFAVAFSPDGAAVLCAAPSGVYRNTNGSWGRSDTPASAAPGRSIVFGQTPGQVYLLGRDRLFSSIDGGVRFGPVQDDANGGAGLETLAIMRQPSETIFAIAHGGLMASHDSGMHWQQRSIPAASEPIETVIVDPAVAGRVWVAAADRLHLSSDAGVTWRAVGSPLPELHTVVRGVAADPTATTLVVTTHRGTYRSTDAGANWTLEEGNLPVHLEAGPLTRDPVDPGILYVVYSLIPYSEVWRSALDGSNLLARVDPMSLIGGLAFLLLLALSGILLVTWLTRRRRDIAR